MLARPVLIHLMWAGDALADLSGPVGDETMVRARLRGGGMTASRSSLCVGTRLTIVGDTITVTSVEGANVAGFDTSRYRLPGRRLTE
jgi:hypothetical protein